MVAAEVIGQDPSSWFKSVTITRERRMECKKGMAVISPGGVVGQILKAAPHYATVLLITDYNSAVDSIVQRTRAKAIVEGKGRKPVPAEIPPPNRGGGRRGCRRHLGVGRKFSKGVMIGEIREVEKKGHGVFQYAELVPSVDLTRLEEVLVITEPRSLFAIEEKAKKAKKGRREKNETDLLLLLRGNSCSHPSDDVSGFLSHSKDQAGLHAHPHPLSGLFISAGPRRDPGLLHGLSGRPLFRKHLWLLYLFEAPPVLTGPIFSRSNSTSKDFPSSSFSSSSSSFFEGLLLLLLLSLLSPALSFISIPSFYFPLPSIHLYRR